MDHAQLLLNISAVERETGLSKDVLRIWERRYGFPEPHRDDNAERQYPQEQVAMLTQGEFELTIEGKPVRFGPGSVIVIPSNVRHSGLAITDCKLMDVFTPVREDFRALSEKK